MLRGSTHATSAQPEPGPERTSMSSALSINHDMRSLYKLINRVYEAHHDSEIARIHRTCHDVASEPGPGHGYSESSRWFSGPLIHMYVLCHGHKHGFSKQDSSEVHAHVIVEASSYCH